ncbi:uncharacterized protein V1516DRAFT_680516 [Lipomyces oligophaga]|uniref:uncharacterized protein n=1 Tax=Lipomyces oligophaga TaxID=45792 RepID=UPI0034CFD586
MTISAFALQELMVEYANIGSLCPSGVYVSASPTTPQVWYGVIFIRKGPYAGGIFRFMLFFPDLYPFTLPILRLLSPLSSHPLVHALTNEFDLDIVEKTEDEQQLLDESDYVQSIFRVNGRVLTGRVLSYFKRSFKSGGLDRIRGLYQRDPGKFCALAAQDVALSRATHALYEEDESGDPYAGDDTAAISLAIEENTVKFIRLEPGAVSSRPISVRSSQLAPSNQTESSIRSSSNNSESNTLSTDRFGKIESGIWQLMLKEGAKASIIRS